MSAPNLAPLPCTPRARDAYASLRALELPASLAARAVHDLENTPDIRVRASVLARIPELPITEHHFWLTKHRYANCCERCYRELPSHKTCNINPRTLRLRCVPCAVTDNEEDQEGLCP